MQLHGSLWLGYLGHYRYVHDSLVMPNIPCSRCSICSAHSAWYDMSVVHNMLDNCVWLHATLVVFLAQRIKVLPLAMTSIRYIWIFLAQGIEVLPLAVTSIYYCYILLVFLYNTLNSCAFACPDLAYIFHNETLLYTSVLA